MRFPLCITSVAIVFASCHTVLRPVQTTATYYSVDHTLPADSLIQQFIQPYHDSLARSLNNVIAVSSIEMPKGKPESLLGNFLADLLLEMARKYNNDSTDISILNYGGIRLPSLPAGPITTGMVYELMPFDNYLVVMRLKGKRIEQLFHTIAADGGWPVAGASFVIKDGRATQIFIQHEPLDTLREYTVALSDYLADGGDNLLFLREENRKNLGIFIRDIIIEYMHEQTLQNKLLSATLDKRISQ
ncbi:MAG: 5'-nucleotidase [Chitinophagales bacterium]|nr:MAG: 5'-nucleotidase [Chitinophagales bacterium]